MTGLLWWMKKKPPSCCMTSGNRYVTLMGFMDVALFFLKKWISPEGSLICVLPREG